VFNLHPIPATMTDSSHPGPWLACMAVLCSIVRQIGDRTSSFGVWGVTASLRLGVRHDGIVPDVPLEHRCNRFLLKTRRW